MRRISVLLALAAACSEPDFWAFSSGSDGTKAVVIWGSDSPVDDADELAVTIDSVELRGPSGTHVLSSTPRTIELLEELNRDGLTLLIVTHDAVLGARSRRCLGMRDGRIVSDCQPHGGA